MAVAACRAVTRAGIPVAILAEIVAETPAAVAAEALVDVGTEGGWRYNA